MLLPLAALPAILLRPIDNAAPTGTAVAAVLTRRVADELRKEAQVGVTVLQDGSTPPATPTLRADPGSRGGEGSRNAATADGASSSPLPGGARAREAGAGEGFTPPPSSPGERRIARSVGASHILAGVLTAYPSSDEGRAGKAVLLLRLTGIAGEATREATIEVAVAPRAKADKVAAALAREAAAVFRQKFLPEVAAAALQKGAATAASLMQEAKDALEVGDLDTARRVLGEAIRLAPRDAGVNAALGDLDVALGRVAAAISRYRQALLFEPGNASVRLRLLRALETHGLLEDLASEGRRAVEAGIIEAEVWRRLGRASLALGSASDAGVAYERSLTLEPAVAEAIRGQTLLWIATGQAGRAVRLLASRGVSGERQLSDLAAFAKVLPVEAEAEAAARFPAPAAGADAAAFEVWSAALSAEARLLLAMGRRAPASGLGRMEVRRERLAVSARAHGLLRLANAAVAPAEVATAHDRLLGGLRSLARAALAAAVAEEWPWPGSGAVVARLWDEVERSLGRGTAVGSGSRREDARNHWIARRAKYEVHENGATCVTPLTRSAEERI